MSNFHLLQIPLTSDKPAMVETAVGQLLHVVLIF